MGESGAGHTEGEGEGEAGRRGEEREEASKWMMNWKKAGTGSVPVPYPPQRGEHQR